MKKMIMLILVLFTNIIYGIPQKNIVDYFLSLPENALNLGLKTIESRRNALSNKYKFQVWGYDEIDKVNGYLKLKNPGMGGGEELEIVMWSDSGKPDLIGVNQIICGMPGCFYGSIQFFEFKNEHWHDVTNLVFPGISENDFIKDQAVKNMYSCKLPKVGVDILCYNLDFSEEIRYSWANGKFLKKPVVKLKK